MSEQVPWIEAHWEDLDKDTINWLYSLSHNARHKVRLAFRTGTGYQESPLWKSLQSIYSKNFITSPVLVKSEFGQDLFEVDFVLEAIYATASYCEYRKKQRKNPNTGGN